jgi:KDO2-lipid IV(A) lauroyltransferase
VFKTKRGHYQLEYELITENAAGMPTGELTRRYADYLERAMRAHPDCWLWSHRRWKREWKPEYEKLWIDEGPVPSSENIKP